MRYCSYCRTERLDGPTDCPKCGTLLGPLPSTPEPAPAAPVLPPEEHAITRFVRTGRCSGWQILYRGLCMGVQAWANKVGLDPVVLAARIRLGEDITPILRGEAAPLPAPSENLRPEMAAVYAKLRRLDIVTRQLTALTAEKAQLIAELA